MFLCASRFRVPLPGAPVVPFYPFSFWVPLLKPNSTKKGTLIIKGLLGNLAFVDPTGNIAGNTFRRTSVLQLPNCPWLSCRSGRRGASDPKP